MTLPIAIFGFLYFPDIPSTTKSKYLSLEERKLAVSRLPVVNPEGHSINPKSLFKRVIMNPIL